MPGLPQVKRNTDANLPGHNLNPFISVERTDKKNKAAETIIIHSERAKEHIISLHPSSSRQEAEDTGFPGGDSRVSSAGIMDKITSLCKRRGYIYPSSEIYGGINSCWDYGPLGVELKRNIKELWWKSMTYLREEIVGLDASIIMHPGVWEASGHVKGFNEPLVDCKGCRERFKGTEITDGKCPRCGGELTEMRPFNLMFKTHIGPVESEEDTVYLRPETAQGIYVNFQNVLNSSRQKLPFGIAQIGKAFRNEITPGNFIFRTREFEQMEMQYLIFPETADKWLDYWREERLLWYQSLGIKKENLRLHEHTPDELPHYASRAYDIEYNFPFGWSELEGIHNRTDYDLSRHSQCSGKNLDYFNEKTQTKFIPYIIETSAGVDRTLLTILIDAYREEEKRVVLGISAELAPVKVAVLPLVKDENMVKMAKKIASELRVHLKTFYDEAGSIGRRYRRQDEVGTPFAVTVDGDSLEGNDVTIRERDSMKQVRVKVDELKDKIRSMVCKEGL